MLNRRLSDDPHLRQRKAVWIGLALAIALDTTAQLCWKAATFHAPASASIWQTLVITFRQPLFHVTVLLFILMFFNWMIVLSNADLSYAQPITALSYVTVSVVAVVLLGEDIPPQRMIGITMILFGVWFISSTSHRTVIPGAQSQSAQQQTQDLRLSKSKQVYAVIKATNVMIATD
ncbi:MAG: EamA family transporter [Thermodesulfobacteriota bacterium]|jgi:drug/metabolite transporter (DMT)-like permease